MMTFNPEYSKKQYSPRDALAFALVSQLAYEIKYKQNWEYVKSTLAKWEFSDYTIFDKRLGYRIDTQGFIASNQNHIIITFCGSESSADWLTNFISIIDPGPFPNTFVHEGFQDAIFPVVIKIALTLQKYNPDQNKSIWITGHSLGGALAVLLGAMLIEDDFPVQGIYTFGAPRVGDPNFAQSLDQKINGIFYRVVNEGDIVPHLPPKFLGFNHSEKVVLFQSDGTRVDNDINTWKDFREDIIAWLSHLGKKNLAVKAFHQLATENGYLQKLEQDLNQK